jgi:signal transduction histidine kinase
VPLEALNGYSLLMVESQPLVYAPGAGSRRGQYFAGLLLRDSQGQYMGAGGWWIDPRGFLVDHLNDVIQERLPTNPRMYGGFESTRRLSVSIHDPRGVEIGRLRSPGSQRTARSEQFSGPFESYSVRVAATANAPVVWTGRFVAIEITFIALMVLAIVVATVFGLRYTLRQLELAQLKAGFVSNVTHELKTPIALIRLAVETLEMRRYTSPEESEKFLQTIGRETQRLSQLVDNILDFARLEAGRHVFRFEEVDVVQLVRETVEAFRPRFEHLGFVVDLDLPPSLPAVRGDQVALTHCLLNLLDNAIKYSKARRRVRIAARARGDEVAISVTDHGIGIDPGDQKRIFEKFVRLETGLIHDVKGAGLGLSLVDQIIRGHGGRIEVESAPGEGSTFTLVLPSAALLAARPAELPAKREVEPPLEPTRQTGS